MQPIFHRTALIFICLAFSSIEIAAAKPLKVVAEPWPPYVERNLPKEGLSFDIVTTALEGAGYETQTEIGEVGRTLTSVELGLNDVMAIVWQTDERAKALAFSEPYLVNRITVVKWAGSPYTFQDIKYGTQPNLVMGIVGDYAYGDALRPLISYRRVPHNYLIQVLLRIGQGRVDFGVGDELAIRYHVNEYLRDRAAAYQISPEPVGERKLRIGVSRKHPDHEAIVAGFDKALDEMKTDGSFEAILEKHLGPEVAACVMDYEGCVPPARSN